LIVSPLEGERVEAQGQSRNAAMEIVDETHERTPTRKRLFSLQPLGATACSDYRLASVRERTDLVAASAGERDGAER
jgi:hypothetical protein